MQWESGELRKWERWEVPNEIKRVIEEPKIIPRSDKSRERGLGGIRKVCPCLISISPSGLYSTGKTPGNKS